jgi:hypothetical protein
LERNKTDEKADKNKAGAWECERRCGDYKDEEKKIKEMKNDEEKKKEEECIKKKCMWKKQRIIRCNCSSTKGREEECMEGSGERDRRIKPRHRWDNITRTSGNN